MTVRQTLHELKNLDWLTDGKRRRKLMFSIGWHKKDLERHGVDVEQLLKSNVLNKASNDRIKKFWSTCGKGTKDGKG